VQKIFVVMKARALKNKKLDYSKDKMMVGKLLSIGTYVTESTPFS